MPPLLHRVMHRAFLPALRTRKPAPNRKIQIDIQLLRLTLELAFDGSRLACWHRLWDVAADQIELEGNVGDKTLFWFGIWGSPRDGIHVALWDRDRLGYLQPVEGAKKQPHVISAPVNVSAKDHRIKLNISGLGEDAEIKVSLLDEQFREIPG